MEQIAANWGSVRGAPCPGNLELIGDQVSKKKHVY